MIWFSHRKETMTFQNLHELLRVELLRRIDTGTLTRSALARQTGFRQAHVSNFLNRKRSLSMEGLDRVLAATKLSIEQFLPLNVSAAESVAVRSPPPDELERIPVVSPSTAMDDALVHPNSVLETVPLAVSRLADHRSRPTAKYAHWQRMVAVRADAQQAHAMDPMIAPGAIVVLDRHYQSLAPYRAHQRTLYAVRAGAGLVLRYVECNAGCLILRPLAHDVPVQLLPLGTHESPADYLVGRVSHILSDL